MKIIPRIAFVLIGWLVVSSASAQGPLTPPGAPAPSMKTLAQIEPRIPVGPGTDIGQPGSYYLTTNISGFVRINASGVTLDLMGFHILNGGINITNPAVNGAVVRNGIIRNTSSGASVDGFVTDSVFSRNVLMENVVILDSGFQGIRAGVGWTLRNVVVQGSANAGIQGLTDVTLEQCTVRSNGLSGVGNGISLGARARVMNTVSDDNANTGVVLGDNAIVQDLRVRENGGNGLTIGLGSGSMVERVVAATNGAIGILVASTKSRIMDCVAVGNGSHGLNATNDVVVTGCLASDNGGVGIMVGNDAMIQSSTASRNASGGIVALLVGAISDCVADENGVATANTNAHGFRVTGWVTLRDNVSVRNRGDGIRVTGSQCTIDGNMVRSNQGTGINLPANNNVVIRNNVNLNTMTNINLSGGGVAPLVGTAAASHPFSNLQ
jgi:hypothetical protein